MLRQEPGIASPSADVHEAERAHRDGGQAQGRPQYLAAALPMRTIEGKNVHPFSVPTDGVRIGADCMIVR
jgi:hypothetical protein